MAAQIVLRYMNGLEGDPLNYTVPFTESTDITVVQVVKRQNGRFELRRESWTTKNANDVYARFQASPPFLFEPLVDGVIIEPPPSDALSLFPALANIKVPVSSDTSYSFICLRLGDTVSFSLHDYFKFQFDIRLPDIAPLPAVMASSGAVHDSADDGAFTPVLQVRSSDGQSEQLHEPEERTDYGANDESSSETDDEDLDQSTARTLRTPFLGDQGTPATSNPMTIGEIKETPARSSMVPSTKAQDEPSSTAPEDSDNIKVTSSAVDCAIDKNSPLANKTRESQDDLPSTSLHAESEMEAAINAADEESRSDAASEELGEIFVSEPNKPIQPLVRYGTQPVRRGKRSVSVKRSVMRSSDAVEDEENIHVTATSDAANDELDHLPIADDEDIETALAFDATNEELGLDQISDGDNIEVARVSDSMNEETDIVQTSDPLDEHGAAHKAAERTIQQSNLKRKRRPKAAHEEDEEDNAPVPQKRVRKSTAKSTANAEPTSPASPKGAVAKATRSSKPAKVTREDSAEDSAEDEITVTQVQKVVKKTTTPKSKVTPSSRKPISGGKAPGATPDSSASTAMSGKTPKVIFSSSSTLASAKNIHKWLKQQDSEVLNVVRTKRTHFVCVVKNGQLATTAKVLRTLAMGKLVVTDDWITDSQREGQLLEPDDYVHAALEDTIDVDRSTLFEEKIMYFTAKLVKEYGSGWDDVKELAKECGAKMIDNGSATKGEKTAQMGETLFFGAEKDDKDATELIRAQHVVYHKDLLAKGVLRGEVDLDSDEFELQVATPSAKKKKSRKR